MVRFKTQISKIKSKELRVGQCRTCQTNLCALRSLEIPFLSWNGRCLSLKLCLCSSPACVAQHEDHLVAEFLNDATVLLGLKTRFENLNSESELYLYHLVHDEHVIWTKPKLAFGLPKNTALANFFQLPSSELNQIGEVEQTLHMLSKICMIMAASMAVVSSWGCCTFPSCWKFQARLWSCQLDWSESFASFAQDLLWNSFRSWAHF